MPRAAQPGADSVKQTALFHLFFRRFSSQTAIPAQPLKKASAHSPANRSTINGKILPTVLRFFCIQILIQSFTLQNCASSASLLKMNAMNSQANLSFLPSPANRALSPRTTAASSSPTHVLTSGIYILHLLI